MSFKLDTRKFRKISSNEKTTTMRHPAGHEIVIAHGSLSPKIREQLSQLPMATEGGDVKDPTQEHLLPGDALPNRIEKKVVHQTKMKMAKGGEAEVKDVELKEPETKDVDLDNPPIPPIAKDATPEQVAAETNAAASEDLARAQPSPAPNMPGDVQATEPPALAEAQTISTPTSPAAAQQAPMAAQPTMGQAPLPPEPAPVQAARQNATKGATQAGATAAKVGTADESMIRQVPGASEQLEGIEQTKRASQQQAKTAMTATADKLKSDQDAQLNMQQQLQDIIAEGQGFIEDAKANHINPNHYMESLGTGQKMMTAIGLILGGAGGGTGPNPALDFMNKQIDRDIAAQHANLGKTMSLLAANMHRFSNVRDAADMTKAMITGLYADKLDQAAASTGDLMAKARANAASGQLKQSIAPLAFSLAMRRALARPSTGGLKQEDPASYVNFAQGPDEAKKGALVEIGNAQNAQKNRDEILKNFDIAANSPLKSIGVGQGTVAQKTLEALFLPMIHDQEGRVNEYEAKTLHDLMPTTLDTDATIEGKRRGLEAFMDNKRAAPHAKSLDIDLNNFQSTAGNPIDRLHPAQKAMAIWAKAHPEDPRAKMVLEKLGI